MVCAGTIHVFAVVGYDIASSSYYVYTYGVQDDDTYDFIDYSKQTHSFDDYENGILPFEVPFEVNQYIDNALLRSKGLVYDSETGTVVDYTGEGTDVYIPDYISILRKYQIKLSKDVHHLLLSRQRDYKLLAIKRLVDVAVWMILR